MRADDGDATRFAAASLARGDATGWFERLYAAGAAGHATVPWDRPDANRLLVEWARDARVDGRGRSALVVGCGLGRDAEFVAACGFATVAFDIAETAVRVARERNPGTAVDYRVADLLALPAGWDRSFDLVVESYTVQALPARLRAGAVAAVGRPVAVGGSLLVIAAARTVGGPEPAGPPWPLTRAEVDGFAVDGLSAVTVEELPDPVDASVVRWRALFRR